MFETFIWSASTCIATLSTHPYVIYVTYIMCASIAKLLLGLVDIVYTGQQADNDIYIGVLLTFALSVLQPSILCL